MGKIVPRFSVGDVVNHKSNKEVSMVIIDIDNDVDTDDLVEYECSWIDKLGKYHTEDLLDVELEKAK
jgi:uncharacterized protein YodC (DUF2158 family)